MIKNFAYVLSSKISVANMATSKIATREFKPIRFDKGFVSPSWFLKYVSNKGYWKRMKEATASNSLKALRSLGEFEVIQMQKMKYEIRAKIEPARKRAMSLVLASVSYFEATRIDLMVSITKVMSIAILRTYLGPRENLEDFFSVGSVGMDLRWISLFMREGSEKMQNEMNKGSFATGYEPSGNFYSLNKIYRKVFIAKA